MVYNHRAHLRQSIITLLGCLLLFGVNLVPAHAEPAAEPIVAYTPGNNSIVIGSDAGAAPRSEILTFSALKTKLDALPGGAAALVSDPEVSGAWVLKANIVIKTTASLQIVKDTSVTTLRIESLPFKAFYIEVQRGGHLLLDGITVTSWDTANRKPDEVITDQRSYIDAVDGAQMDILNSDIGYLGSGASASTYGLTWRKRLVIADPATGATGTINKSKIHNNYVGIYIADGHGLKVLNTEIYSNLSEGLLAKDGSRNIEAATNDVHNNGTDGMNFVGATGLSVHDNTVYANTTNGIILEGGSNSNIVNKNIARDHTAGDGIAISISNNNTISGNNVHGNKNGIRVSGSASAMATGNQIITNTVTANNVGIYLYKHGDRNVLLSNQITLNTEYGVYIKSGGNRLEKNTVTNKNAVGIGINADAPDGLQGAEVSGSNNVIIGSTITNNEGVGIKLTGGANNRIGVDPAAPAVSNGNLIEGNMGDGIAMSDGTSGIGTTDTLVSGNTLRNNANGVSVSEVGSVRNRISRNIMTANTSNAIKVNLGAQQNIQKPVITAVLADNEVQGTAVAGGTVEIYTDPGGEAQDFWGDALVGTDGKWKFPLPVGQDPKNVTALVIDQNGNTSAISARSGNTAGPFYKVEELAGQTTIVTTGDGETVTLSSIKIGLGAANTGLLNDLGSGKWELNANLMIAKGVTLELAQASGVTELRLRSTNVVQAASAAALPSFVYVRTHDGTINIDGVKIYSWDSTTSAPDSDLTNGRAYIIAKYTAKMNITNSELSYLGSDLGRDTDMRGVTWRDSNDSASPGVLRVRVTGRVIGSKFHHNYIGASTVQANNIVFENNEFYENSQHGLHIDDFSKGTKDESSETVEVKNNRAYSNLGHGFYLSRGVATITLGGNKAYKNSLHGFMIDAGSSIPASPSIDNIFKENEAYENQGLGMRVIESNNNILLNNRFYKNISSGMSVEKKSTANRIEGNHMNENQKNGLDLDDSADANIIASNVISQNVVNGLYIRSNNNVINNNKISGNQKVGVLFSSESATAIQNNQFTANTVTGNVTSGVDVRSAAGTRIENNEIYGNGQHGIYLTVATSGVGATNTLMLRNKIYNNKGYGIRCSDLNAFSNKWSENSLFDNEAGGVAVTDGANSSVSPAVSVSVRLRVVTGSAQPGATVEIFTDNNGQGHHYQGSTTVQPDGKFSFTLTAGKWLGAQITTVVIDANNNASRFSSGENAPILPDNIYLPLVVKR